MLLTPYNMYTECNPEELGSNPTSLNNQEWSMYLTDYFATVVCLLALLQHTMQ